MLVFRQLLERSADQRPSWTSRGFSGAISRRSAPSESLVQARRWMSIAAAAWTIGVAALLCDHFQASRAVLIGTHTLFPISTSGALGWILLPRRRPAGMELCSWIRLVSRWVYILMYGLAAVRLCLNLHDPARSMDDFDFYIACCIAPLWLLRAIVLTMPRSRATV